MITLDSFIRDYDVDNTVKQAVADCICKNITEPVAIDVLAADLQKRLYKFIWVNDDLDIDDGSNVERDFKKEIENILKEYFDL